MRVDDIADQFGVAFGLPFSGVSFDPNCENTRLRNASELLARADAVIE